MEACSTHVAREAASESCGLGTGNFVAQMQYGSTQCGKHTHSTAGSSAWMSLGSGMIGGVNEVWCYILVTSQWHAVWRSDVCDVAVPCGLAESLCGKCVCVCP